jgi:putative transcriptional regulator
LAEVAHPILQSILRPSTVDSLQGHLLIASHELRDPNFFHSVVLIIRHEEDGALGLVLNRPTKANIQQVWKQLSESPCLSDERLHVGGPVEGLLMALHTVPLWADLEIVPGVYYSGDPDHIKELVQQTDGVLRFYVGYAGWSAGQLERELEEGSWLVKPATEEQIFSVDDKTWELLTREITASSIFSALRIKHVPSDPRMN